MRSGIVQANYRIFTGGSQLERLFSSSDAGVLISNMNLTAGPLTSGGPSPITAHYRTLHSGHLSWSSPLVQPRVTLKSAALHGHWSVVEDTWKWPCSAGRVSSSVSESLIPAPCQIWPPQVGTPWVFITPEDKISSVFGPDLPLSTCSYDCHIWWMFLLWAKLEMFLSCTDERWLKKLNLQDGACWSLSSEFHRIFERNY